MNKSIKSFFEFTLAPLLIFIIALSIFLFFNWLFSKESNTEKLLEELQFSMSRKKWQVAYDLATNKKHLDYIKNSVRAYNIVSDLLKKALEQYPSIAPPQKDDMVRFIEYLIYLLSYCNNEKVNSFFRENLLKRYNDFLDVAILAIGNTARVELTPDLVELYPQVPSNIQIKILFVLGILQTPEAKQLLLKEFYSEDTLKKLNSAFALARTREKIVLPYFEYLLMEDNYKKLQIKDADGIRVINEQEEISILGNILKSIRFFKPEEVKNFAGLISELESKTKHFTIRRLCKEMIFWINNDGRK